MKQQSRKALKFHIFSLVVHVNSRTAKLLPLRAGEEGECHGGGREGWGGVGGRGSSAYSTVKIVRFARTRSAYYI